MEAIIQVFRMTEVSAKSRIKIIKHLGSIINYKMASNVTEPLVYELVMALDPDDEIKDDENYTRHLAT